ncbi:MAG: HAD hydrolase-like protein [Dehalococcoidales bacterium]|nr:MAG: HAD hydrolase-like protein [Dehalococcoidales bacterium]
MIGNVFFDLDGTLTDPKEGITRCIQYSLKQLGRPYPSDLKPTDFIGPPLRSTFAKLLCSDEKPLIEKAMSLYRERFSEVGIFENMVYPGIDEVLSALHEKSLRLYVVTTKPTVYAERIIKHFSLAQWFSDIFGTELDGRFDNKAELVEFILRNLKLVPEETAMVGDKKEDIIAAKSNRIRTIGFTYGYGSKQEISNSAPDYVCNSPSEVQMTIMSICETV